MPSLRCETSVFPGNGDFVDTLEAVDDHRLLESELPEDGGDLRDERRGVEAQELVRPGRG